MKMFTENYIYFKIKHTSNRCCEIELMNDKNLKYVAFELYSLYIYVKCPAWLVNYDHKQISLIKNSQRRHKQMTETMNIIHLFKFFVVRQVSGAVFGFCLYFTCVWWGWKWPKRVPRKWEFSKTDCLNSCVLLDGVFPVRGVVCGSNVLRSGRGWSVPSRYDQAFKIHM